MTNPQNCEDCGRFGPVVVLGPGRFSFRVCMDCARNIAAVVREVEAEAVAADWLALDLPAMRKVVRAENPDWTGVQVAVEAIRRLDVRS